MEKLGKKFRWHIWGLFLGSIGFIFYIVLAQASTNLLKVVFIDVGQGDSIYIQAPNGNQVLVDGGQDGGILKSLGEIIPFYDHSINVVVATHPDKDHIGGLPSVLDNYQVDEVLEPGIPSTTQTYAALENLITEKKINKVLARRGMNIWLDKEKGVYLQILFPDQDVSSWKDTNEASIVAKLIYGKESFLLTGDSPQKIEKYLISLNHGELKSNVLKLGHHGSRTSSSEEYLQAVSPDYAIISAGLNNRYGHPHQEVLDLLAKLKIPSLKTFELGNITFETDGEKLFR